MTNDTFARKFINVAENIKTRYATGGWGQPLTEANKQYFLKQYPKNTSNSTIKNGIITATDDTFAMDCVCGFKSIVDGFTGDKTKVYGGATYGVPCPDITIEAILKQECVDVSTDFSNILIGEFVAYADYSHCGVYVGLINNKKTVAEVTYRWLNGMQLVDMDCAARKGKWKYHGKLWNWMDYKYKGDSLPNVNPSPAPVDVTALREIADVKLKAKKGDNGLYVTEIQKVLIGRGYPCGTTGADGKFGTNTEKAVKSFQTANSLTSTGIVDYDTVRKLIGD